MNNININTIKGTGKNGRVTKTDVLAALGKVDVPKTSD